MRGRPRKQKIDLAPVGIAGKPSGPPQPISGPVKARMRVYGLTQEEASKPEAGSALGRLALPDTLYEVGKWIEASHRSYLRSKGFKGQRSPLDIDATSEGPPMDEDQYTEWCLSTDRKWKSIRKAILKSSDPMAMLAVRYVVLDDCDMPSLKPHLVNALRSVLTVYHSR